MKTKIAAAFLLGAAAATTGAYIAVRRIAAAPAAVMAIAVNPPTAPDVTVPVRPVEPASGPGVVRTAVVREQPPAFYLDPRPPAPREETQPEPEPEPPVLSAPELSIPMPPIDLGNAAKLPPPGPHRVTIPQGTAIAVRLSEPLSTKSRQRGEKFAAALEHDLVIGGFVIAEHGSRAEGRISESEQAGRVTGLARLSLELTKLSGTDGQEILIRTTHFVKSGPESKIDDGAKVALGTGLGAAIGAATARGKGAAIGAAAGAAAGAATVALTRGKPAELGVEARLTFTLQDAVTLTERVQ